MLIGVVAEVTDTPVWVLAGATIAVAIGAFAALISIIDARKTRNGQLLVELSSRWDDPTVLESASLSRVFGPVRKTKLVEELWSPGVTEHEPKQMDDWLKLSVFPNLIEAFGVLWSEGIVSERVFYKNWGGLIALAWDEWKEPVYRLRELTKDDTSGTTSSSSRRRCAA